MNVSTKNVLAERNQFFKGHGVSIGSETSGWITNVTIRDSVLNGTDKAVRIKSARGRGGGVADVAYQNLRGSAKTGISLSLEYDESDPTNESATPALKNIRVENVTVAADAAYVECLGLNDSAIEDVSFVDVAVSGASAQTCSYCAIAHDGVAPPLKDACTGEASATPMSRRTAP